MIVTIRLPAISGRWATLSVAASAEPEEMPAGMPSVRASRRAAANDSSLEKLYELKRRRAYRALHDRLVAFARMSNRCPARFLAPGLCVAPGFRRRRVIDNAEDGFTAEQIAADIYHGLPVERPSAEHPA